MEIPYRILKNRLSDDKNEIRQKVKRIHKDVQKITSDNSPAFFLLFLTNCQTVQGVGGDIKWTGQKGAEVFEGT